MEIVPIDSIYEAQFLHRVYAITTYYRGIELTDCRNVSVDLRNMNSQKFSEQGKYNSVSWWQVIRVMDSGCI